MAIEKIVINEVEIEDKPGSLHNFLSALAAAKVNLRCAAAFSAAGRGKVFIAAKNPEKLKSYAEQARLQLHPMAGFVRSGKDAIGAGASAIRPLADAGINVAACTATVCNGRYHMLIVVNEADGEAAAKTLRTRK